MHFFKKIFSISDYNETHKILCILGLRIKFIKHEISVQKRKNLYYYYREHNIDITTIPPATGQLRDIQLAGLYMLKEFDIVCKKLNIKYWLDFGTLMGAIRHKGFIPWDDDIDLGMLRNDYNILIEKFNENVNDKNMYLDYYKRKNMGMVKIYYRGISELCIDIFPYDFYNKKLTHEEQLIQTEIQKSIRKNFLSKKSSPMSPFEYHNYFEKFTCGVSDIEDSDVIWGMEYGHNWKKWIHSYFTIFPLKNQSFEGFSVPCINDYHHYLNDIYGDYMKYPKRITLGHSMYHKFSMQEIEILKALKEKVLEK